MKWLQPIVLKWLTLSGQLLRRPCQGWGEGSHVARLNFKTSRAGVYKCVTYCRLCRHCREGGCLLSQFHFTCCRYFLSHVACRNLPCQGLTKDQASERKIEHKERPTTAVQFPKNYWFHIPCNLKS